MKFMGPAGEFIHEDECARTLGFEDRPDTYVIWVEWRFDGELVRRDHYPILKTLGHEIETIHGIVPRGSLVRTLELLENDNEIVLAEIFRRGEEIVKRSPHLILKRASVMTAGAVGGF